MGGRTFRDTLDPNASPTLADDILAPRGPA
jgi:hypothetical protein